MTERTEDEKKMAFRAIMAPFRGAYGAQDYKILFQGKEYTITIDFDGQTVTPRNRMIEWVMNSKTFSDSLYGTTSDGAYMDSLSMCLAPLALLPLSPVGTMKRLYKKILKMSLGLKSDKELQDVLDLDDK